MSDKKKALRVYGPLYFACLLLSSLTLTATFILLGITAPWIMLAGFMQGITWSTIWEAITGESTL